MFDQLSTFHKDQLLHVLTYHMGTEMRQKLMLSVPDAYNALCGRVVVSSQVEPYSNNGVCHGGRTVIAGNSTIQPKESDK